MDVLNRGQFAEAAQVNIETLRYYERRGLILAPPRSLANTVATAEHHQPRTVCQACSGSWMLRIRAQVSGGTQLRQTGTMSETHKAGLAVHLGFAWSCGSQYWRLSSMLEVDQSQHTELRSDPVSRGAATHPGIVIVTGSNGSIGNAIMGRFAHRFADVVGFDRKAPAPPPPGCTAVPVDITSDESVHGGLRVIHDHHGAHVASVIHLAAYYDFFGEPSPKYDEVTVRGTARILKGLREFGFLVEQFVFSSTMLVHRAAEPGLFIDEDWPLEPTWAYPESKVRTEQLIREQRGDIPAVLLRIAGVYDDLCHSIPLAHQIQRIYERRFTSRLYSGSTSHGQSFIHMDDLVDTIELVVERRAALPAVLPLLVGEPEPLSYDELQHTFARLIHGKDWETLAVPGPLTPVAKAGAWVLEKLPGSDPFIKPWMIERANDHYALDISRARTLLGWQPRRSLRGTIPKMIAALKADPLRWYAENGLEPPAWLKEQRAPEKEAGPG